MYFNSILSIVILSDSDVRPMFWTSNYGWNEKSSVLILSRNIRILYTMHCSSNFQNGGQSVSKKFTTETMFSGRATNYDRIKQSSFSLDFTVIKQPERWRPLAPRCSRFDSRQTPDERSCQYAPVFPSSKIFSRLLPTANYFNSAFLSLTLCERSRLGCPRTDAS